MDEILVQVVVDLLGCFYLVFDVELINLWLGSFEIEVIEDFFQVLVFVVEMNLYVWVLYGCNIYYKIEVFFKVIGCVLCQVVMINLVIEGVNFMKGVI